jgi:hypothetical protein
MPEGGAMRRIMVAGATLALLLLAALPAQAKVAGEANISGPGLPGGGSINLDGSDGAGWAAFSGLLDVGAVGMEEPPTKDLGPRYEVVLDVRQPPQTKDIVQHLYPYAEGGPLLYTPPGQKLLDFQAPSGWAAATTDLMDMLHEAGLPESAPVVEPETEPAALPDPRVTATDEGASSVVWAIAGLAGLLLVAAVTARRRIRGAATAR